MKTEVVLITPEMAAEWLTRNKINRAVRQHAVDHYARQMRLGQWRLTHQGICVDAGGNLVDGQHRLRAIVESQVSVEMMVTTLGETTTALAMPLDTGMLRSYADILNIPKKHIEVIRAACEIADGGSRAVRITTAETAAVHVQMRGQLEALPSILNHAMAAHRLATILAAMLAPDRAEEIREQSAWFVTGSNCTQWWPSVEALNRLVKQAPRTRWSSTAGRLEYVIRWRLAMVYPDWKISRITNEVLMGREVREQCRAIFVASGVRYE